MLVAIFRHNRHTNWDIFYIGAQVSVSPRRRSLPPTFWPNAVRLSSSHHRCWIVLQLKVSLSVEKGEFAYRQWLRRAVPSIIIVDIRHPFTEHRTPSSHKFITHSILSINLTNLPINFSRAKIFDIQIFYHWPYLATGRIFDFHTHFKTKWRTYKQRMRTDNVSDVTF
jgi:hypothetical protein